MDALEHHPLPLAGYTKAANNKTVRLWFDCSRYTEISNASPYLEPAIMLCLIGPRRKPTLMRLDLMVGQEVVLCDLVLGPLS